jgi:SAM-dependent MidA family methyltransferase
MSTRLQEKLIERVKREGAITFRDFMDSALYDQELGYYNTERLKIGAGGDYYTSSNVHPAFGAVLATAFANLWASSAEPLTIVEMGPGSGQLAADLLVTMRYEQPSIYETLSYVLVESSPAMRKLQMEILNSFEDKVSWRGLDQFEDASINGIVYSNEFVDALPVHRIRRRGDSLEEQYVKMENATNLGLCWGQPSANDLAEYVDRVGVPLRDGQVVEINRDALEWLAGTANILKRGFLVTIDYGDVAQHLWTPDRMSGTLRSFYRHRLIDSPLERIGEQDMTASVNFTALIEHGRDLGFETVTFERQTAFLVRLGLIERIAEQNEPSRSLDDLKQRLAVKNLFVPGGVSDSFRVLVQRRIDV